MAYADYQQQPSMIRQPRIEPSGPAERTGGGFFRNALQQALEPSQPVQAAPSPNGTLPPNTRQMALEQVQQAYAAPSRMPGDMGFLNQLLSQSAAPVSASDPTIAPAFEAGRVADQRNLERQRAALAEQLGAKGLGSSGAMQTGIGGIQQRIGEQQALRESGMLYDEGQNRRQALMSALGVDQSRYGVDNNIGLQLAQLEALLNQQAMMPFLTY